MQNQNQNSNFRTIAKYSAYSIDTYGNVKQNKSNKNVPMLKKSCGMFAQVS
jgi:hypothetical protein